MFRCLGLTMVSLMAFLTAGASAAVAQVAANGFVVRHEAHIGAPAARVYETLVSQVGLWWDSEHTFSRDSRNLSIDARPGGCFCEMFPEGGGVEHLRVVHVVPGELLRMSGALGPLQASGLAGSLTWRLTSTSGGTRVELVYSVGGFIDGGFDRIAPAVTTVLGEQLQRLKRFIETGQPSEGAGQ
jgi:uncharacterized protein YndB with AHSA1/START domain